ncbi:MAG: NADH-quinone oxidoreductase subunit J [Verrucomicrobiota bacterium]|nr:NADH-quinone oxidoreductase subunit J [Verrucomicrobiota bacterium]
MNQETAFWILSVVAVLGALVAVRQRNLVHGVFALLLFFAALAGLFLLLMAEFIAAAQVLVYIGAVGILLLFAIMLTERVTGEGKRIFSRGWLGGALAAFAVLGALMLPPLRATELPAHAQPVDPSVRALGEQLMNPYVVTLEVLALLLTAALIGAVATAQGTAKRKGATK